METVKYKVDGMTCGGCSGSLERLLNELDGVSQAKASHEDNSCEVTFDPAKVSDEKIAEIVDKAGFEYKGRA
jgi:copper chaperone